MKDIIRVGMFIAVEEPKGKATKAVGKVIKDIAKKYEKQIDKIVDKVVEEVLKEEVKLEDSEQFQILNYYKIRGECNTLIYGFKKVH